MSRPFIWHWDPVNKAGPLRGLNVAESGTTDVCIRVGTSDYNRSRTENVAPSDWLWRPDRDEGRSVSLPPSMFFSRLREKRSSRGKTAESGTCRDTSLFFLLDLALSKKYRSGGVLIKKTVRRTTQEIAYLLQIYRYNYRLDFIKMN